MNEEVRRDIGKRLRESRIAVGLSQRDVATRLGRKRQTVSAWERGESMPQPEEFYQLGPLYGQSLDYIVYNVRTVPVSGSSVMDTVFGSPGINPPADRFRAPEPVA